MPDGRDYLSSKHVGECDFRVAVEEGECPERILQRHLVRHRFKTQFLRGSFDRAGREVIAEKVARKEEIVERPDSIASNSTVIDSLNQTALKKYSVHRAVKAHFALEDEKRPEPLWLVGVKGRQH